MEGRRKEVLLLVLAVAALGIALYTFRGKPAPPPAGGTPVASQPGSAPAQGNVDAQASAQEGDEQAGASEEGSSEAAAGEAQRNPFSAPGTSVASEAGVGPEAGAGAGAEGSATPEPGMGPEQAEPGGEMGLTLTGIVEGKQTVAILRQNDQRYFVKVGDLVGDGYRVQSIGRQQVVLAGQQGKVILRMGGRQ
ncbi:MAG: hypothetical protein OEV33_03985 [Armatimonadota bacterium]|nr:hypothetical protein [Armatimonadota bacterium]